MFNRKLNKLFLIFFVCLTHNFIAQVFENSPFTNAGLGDFYGNQTTRNGALGNGALAAADSNFINIQNSASMNDISFGYPLFAVDLNSRISNFTYGSKAVSGHYTRFSQLSIAIPVKKWFAFGFGLTPFASKGYDLSSKKLAGTDSVNYFYKGQGSINNAYLNFSFRVLNTRLMKWSIGLNSNVAFGKVSDIRQATFGNGVINGGVDTKSTNLASPHFGVSTLYRIHSNRNVGNYLSIASAFSPKQTLKGSASYGLFYASDVNNLNGGLDTVSFSENVGGSLVLPQNLSVGLAYVFAPKWKSGKNDSQFAIYLDYNKVSWSTYSENFSTLKTYNFVDATRYSIGFQFTPSIDLAKKVAKSSYFKQMSYRVGAYRQGLPLQETFINGPSTEYYQVNENALTFGFGLPVRIQKTNSSFSLGGSFGSRTSGLDTGLSEKFFSFQVGIVVAPGTHERWFRKYKLD